MLLYDPKKKVFVVRSGGVVVKNVRLDGKLIAGRNVSFLGNVKAEEAIFGIGCLINGIIEADSVVLGAKSKFNEIRCNNALIQPMCVGKKIRAKGDVRIYSSIIDVVEAEGVVTVDGSSKLGKLTASKVVAKSEFK